MDCSFRSEETPCSLDGIGSVIIPLLACKRDITSHLVSLGISSKRGQGRTEISESQLILNRAGLIVTEEEIETLTICPKHRKDLTIDWSGQKRNICCYPTHQVQKKQIANPRRVNTVMSAEIFAAFNVVVPIGAGKFSVSLVYRYIPTYFREKFQKIDLNT